MYIKLKLASQFPTFLCVILFYGEMYIKLKLSTNGHLDSEMYIELKWPAHFITLLLVIFMAKCS